MVSWQDGMVWRGSLPAIVGTLVDTTGAPVAGALVWMMKTGDTVTTTVDGRFAFPPVLPGVYAVLATDSTLAESGVVRTSYNWVMLDRQQDAEIRVIFHPRATVLQMLCESYRPGTGVVLGRAFGADGSPLPHARIDVWRRYLASNVELFRQDPGGKAGDDGRFVVCGTPLDQHLRIRATSAADST